MRGEQRERRGARVGALEQRLSRGFEPRSPAPDAELAARLDASGRRSTLQLRRSARPGAASECRGQRGAWLSDSFILRRRQPQTCGAPKREGKRGSRE